MVRVLQEIDLIKNKSDDVAFLQCPPVATRHVEDWIQTPQGHCLLPFHHATLRSEQSGHCSVQCMLCPLRCPWLAPLLARLCPHSSASLHSTSPPCPIRTRACSPCPSFRASASFHLPWETLSWPLGTCGYTFPSAPLFLIIYLCLILSGPGLPPL